MNRPKARGEVMTTGGVVTAGGVMTPGASATFSRNWAPPGALFSSLMFQPFGDLALKLLFKKDIEQKNIFRTK